MKKFKLSRKVLIILATIFVLVLGTIIAGFLSNDETMAGRNCPKCGVPMVAHNQSSTSHQWMCSSSGCGYSMNATHTYDSSTVTAVAAGNNKHYWQCTCPDCGGVYRYNSGVCSDSNGDGWCDNCGAATTNTGGSGGGGESGGGTGKECTCAGGSSSYYEDFRYLDKTLHACYFVCNTCGGEWFDANYAHEVVTKPAVPATCTEPGKTEKKYCSVCNEVLVAQEKIPALGHTVVTEPAVPATCTEPGKTEGKHCSDCGVIIVAQEEIPALGHTEVIDKGKAATCTEQGLTDGKHCSVCNATIVAQEETPALGHTEVVDPAVPATCTETGLTEGKHCSVCNATIVAQEETPAKGHNYENGTCTECGEEQYSEVQITSDEYEINDIYISKIQPGTTVSEFKSNLETNATEITVYNNNEALSDTDKIGTGMTIELKNGNKTKTFTAIVRGDVNGDGDADFTDIVKINQSRLHKITLDEIYSKAADVTDDDKVDLFDILKINMFRLHKITIL